MAILITVITYLVYAAFLGRFLWHLLIWVRAGSAGDARPSSAAAVSLPLCPLIALDLFFFRRLFSSDKTLWMGSWTFHTMFLIVILRHLRYVILPVPGCISFIQPFGVCAGYLLPFAAGCVLVKRIWRREGYVSLYNYFLLGMIIVISATGLLMRTVSRPDLIDIKEFILGVLSFRMTPLPANPLFILHFLLVLALVPYLPFHLFAAPYITIEARRREEGVGALMHDRQDVGGTEAR